MLGRLAFAAVIGFALAACSGSPGPQLSRLSDGLSLLPISERVEHDIGGVDCRPPGGGGGSAGAGPHGEPLAHHHASITCDYPGGDISRLAEAWGAAGTTYLESGGITVTLPGSFGDETLRGLTWQYASGAATGALTITIVPLGNDSYTVLGDLVEFAPKS